MTENRYLEINPEVAAALAGKQAVVALESTIISHGMPYPQNVETALAVEKIVRDQGAVPATIAIIKGKIKVGCSRQEIAYLGQQGHSVAKVSRRDLPLILAQAQDGATTVATTMIAAGLAGIEVFATGGIGGVHRGAETTMDISADLEELANTPVLVVCAGAKSILDLALTLEYLETKGVPVLGYQTDELPAFFTRKSGFKIDGRLQNPQEAANAWLAKKHCGLQGGMVIANPLPPEYSLDFDYINENIEVALKEAEAQGIKGKEVTPFLLAKIQELTKGQSLAANIQIIYNNALLASLIAKEIVADE